MKNGCWPKIRSEEINLEKEETCTLNVCFLYDRKEIETFLRKNTFLHIYGIGDLDDFFWPCTTWYALRENQSIKAIILLYAGHRIYLKRWAKAQCH